jgi:catechol 2,3-dioxygenase-like lactoylglutathione lyase family enzyme
MGVVISGIQQVGIGIPDVNEAFDWYRKNFGVDIKVFEEAATADLMLPYTNGKPKDRHAILALSMKGGGGFEIWQPTSKKADRPTFNIQLGDLGIFASKIKSEDVHKTFKILKQNSVKILGEISKDPWGKEHFFIEDPYGNIFEIVQFDQWFKNEKSTTGGIGGVIIGVSDIERARTLYSDILGYDEVVFDKTAAFEDFKNVPGGEHEMRRVLLRHKQPRKGSFSTLFGPTELELVQVTGRTPKKIFENREWGDAGFIHLCYDIAGMDNLKAKCKEAGFPFTVDSNNSFDMGEAAGRFSYIEDPDGTLIEFVETHKVPLLKSIGWYMNLKNRDPKKPLPNWMLRAMAFNRVKD